VNSTTEKEIVAELDAWVSANWNPDTSLRAWRDRLAEAGWAVPSWPKRFGGRDLPAWADDLVVSRLIEVGTTSTPLGGAMSLAAPTILTHGPDHVRERFLRPILTGEETWCQLFSEPGAGSDLAGLSTTAVRDGDEWVVNGQKVWNTSAHHADFGMLVARTDWDAPKHRGLTYFALPMHQPGVQVRPLRQMNYHQSFNEVFMTDARIPAEFVIGEVGDGWTVASTTLAYERRYGAMGRPRYADTPGRVLSEARAEADDHFAVYRWYPQRAGRADLVPQRAAANGVADDPLVRQQIAAITTLQNVSRWTAERARAARLLRRPPGAEGSIGKLATSNVARASLRAHTTIAGAFGMLSGDADGAGGVVAEVLVSVPAQSIAGGTDEIQRNILGERMLGLPREPAPDKDIPFSKALRN
jgi:alkylation response protein AidB-like acyl-CoA dehydrogenase